MNAGAIAIENRFLKSADRAETQLLFKWLEANVTDQQMVVDFNTKTSYIICDSDLFDSAVFNGVYPVYNLILDQVNRDFTIYKTISSVRI